MVIGDKSKFAIEYELDEDYGDEWLFGKLCYWIKSERIGDYNLGTSLRDVMFQIKILLRDKNNRENERLINLETKELYNILDSALYGYDISEYDEISIKENWARFNVLIPIDVFNDWKVYLIEDKDISRFIIKSFNKKSIYEVIIKYNGFDDILNRVYDELDKLYNNELNKY